MSIVTISRQLGSLGEEVAVALAERIGVTCFDKSALEAVYRDSGIPDEKRERFDEKRPALFDSLTFDKHRYVHFLRAAIVERACAGKALFVGRGSPVFLRGLPGSLHVRLVAPADTRIERVRTANSCNESEARRIVHQSDHDRVGFYRYYFDVDWNSPELYDLTINTNDLTIEKTVDLIERALTAQFLAYTDISFKRKIDDLQLGITVTTKVLYEELLPVRFFAATSTEGVVKISGVTSIPGDVDRCAAIAESVPGVKSVVQAVSYVPDTVGIGM